MVDFENTVFSIVLRLTSQETANSFFGAFNGRYFRDDQIDFSGAPQGSEDAVAYQNEIMHTVFLNDLVMIEDMTGFQINYEY